MENQEPKSAPSSGAEEKKNEHHRRNRKSGKQHPQHRKEKAAPANGNDEGRSKQQKATPPKKQPSRAAQNASSQANPTEGNGNAPKQGNAQGNKKKHTHSRNRQNRNRDGHGYGGARLVSASSVGLYEDAEKEARELAELRAKIVLSSAPAENEVPTAENATPVTDAEQALPTSAQPVEEQVEVVSVRFRSSSKTYYFESRGILAKPGDFAILETARGPEFGEICHGNSMVNVSETVSPLRPLLRLATKEDIAHNEENRKREQEALGICQDKIRKHGLDMKLIDVQYAFDNSKLLFYFTAEGRVDFRDLVKDLASVFHTRIELRQIGIRDETKMLGGIGACGRALCCSTFLPDFAQVSIKMAKEQGLSLNSAKISGVCGRLMCCLRYESDVYAEEIKKAPPMDSTVKTEDGIGRVISINPLAETVRVLFQNGQDTSVKQYHRSEVSVLEKERKAPAEKQEKKAPAENNAEK